MGQAKRVLERQWARRDWAEGIAVRAGAMSACMVHEDAISATQDPEAERDAHAIAGAMFRDGELTELFDRREDVHDILQQVINEGYLAECASCAKHAAE